MKPKRVYKIKTFEERFWRFVSKSEGCWEWSGYKSKSGYGLIGIGSNKSPSLAHRASWIIHFGAINNGLLVCHKCDNPGCVRPDHLFLGTHKDNTQDAVKKGRWPSGEESNPVKFKSNMVRGESHPNSKLNNESVLEVRRLLSLGIPKKEIALKMGVTKWPIYSISNGTTWKHIKATHPLPSDAG